MARRKNAGSNADKIRKWNVALYIRLSKEDGNIESLSVKNQKSLLLEYLENDFVGEYELIDTYIDDGETGTDSERENFQRLLLDIDERRVNCVIVKDPSRLSRNYSEAGHYMEILFVQMDVRFISLSIPQIDSYLQPEQMNSIAIPIQNVMNDDFCRQTSLKIRKVFDYKRRNGQFIGAFAPYGYQKAPDNKNVFVIDEGAAQIVRDIFRWFIKDGMSKIGIAKKLNELGVPNPAAYKRENGMKYTNPSMANGFDCTWNPKTISDILQNQVYLGHMVQGKQQVKSYKVHTRVTKNESEWFICQNTHAPIIDAETFEAAQDLHKRDTRTANGKREVYLFSGFVRCAACKKAMQRNKNRDSLYYVCRSNREKGTCTRHSIRYSVLENVVLSAIRAQVSMVIDVANVINAINQSLETRNKSERLNNMLKERIEERVKMQNVCDSLYPNLVNGTITNEEYHRMKQNYTEQLERLQTAIDKIKEEQSIIAEGITEGHPFFKHFMKYHDIQKLDRNLLVELVEAIYIHEKQPGEKQPSVEIVFKYADQFQLIQDYIESNNHGLTVIEGGQTA